MLTSLIRLAATATALAALAACSSEASPDADGSTDTPTPAPSTSATEDPGPVEPTLPEAATKEGKEGAEAFVEYYWDVVNYARATGDTTLLESLTSPRCTSCSSSLEGLKEVIARGGEIRGGTHTLRRLTTTRSATPGSSAWYTSAEIKYTRERVVGAGDRNQTIPAGRLTAIHQSEWLDGGWQISEITFS